MMKESCNLIGQLATHNQKQWSQILPSLDDYRHAKNLKVSIEINDQRLLQYDWLRTC